MPSDVKPTETGGEKPPCQHPNARYERKGKRYCPDCHAIIYDSYADYCDD